MPNSSGHDEKLSEIFQERESLNEFFNTVFGFFFRHSADVMFDNEKHYGKQVLLSQYEKWQKYYKEQHQKASGQSSNGSKSLKSESFSGQQECWESTPRPGGPTRTTNTTTTSQRRSKSDNTSITQSKKETSYDNEKGSFFDTTNGAKLETYMWSQNREEIEVRIPVASTVRNGSQVKTEISCRKLTVRVQNSNEDVSTVVEGEFYDNVTADECAWFLSPGQYVSLLLEKKEARWWDRLLVDESPIDLSALDKERSFSSLPDEDKIKIEKMVTDQEKEDRGELTSDQEKMASVLREAWDAEGSPFKGQPFDPSVLKNLASSIS